MRIGSVCPSPTSSNIFQSYLQGSKLKLVGLFCHVLVKRDLRALASSFASSFENCPCRWDPSRLYYVVRCHSISICNLNLMGLFSTEHGKRYLDHRLRIENEEMKLEMQQAVVGLEFFQASRF